MIGPSDKPEIAYPCIWSYRLIGNADTDIEALVRAVLGNREFSLEPSRSSATGKYVSHNVSVVVMDDDDRIGIFERFSKRPELKYVL